MRQSAFVSFAAALALSLMLVGCSAESALPEQSDDQGDDRPVVLTTFTVLADMAENVAGERLRVESITQVGAEIHGYEPTAGDLKRAAEADLILDNGLNLEAWFEQFVQDLDVPHVVLTAGVEVINITEDAHAGLANPHAWMSPQNAQVYVQNMVAAFSELAPEYAVEFERNAAAYNAELQGVSDEMREALQQLPAEQRVLVTCEGAFSYLARDAGLQEEFLWAVNAERQATPQNMAAVIDTVREHEIPAVFCESTVSDAPMRQVAEDSGAAFGGTLYVDSLSAADGPVPTYLELIRHDAEVIVRGLTGAES